MANRYINIDNSYSDSGIGSVSEPFNWNQFLVELSGSGLDGLITSKDYYLSGTRILSGGSGDQIIISATNTINFYSWDENTPARITSEGGAFFEIYVPHFGLYDLLIQAIITLPTNSLFDDGLHYGDYGNLIIDNCYLKIGTKLRFKNLDSVIVRNSIIITTNLEGYCNDGMTMSFINSIFDITDFYALEDDNVGTIIFNQCAFTSAITLFTNYGEANTTWTNIHDSWTRPNIFSTAVSAIDIATNLKYIDSPFSLISANGDTSYTNTWFSGRRDGIGALYFPEISGVAVSAISARMPIDTNVSFILSGNNPFTVFSASSATYDWDDARTSAVNTNDIISHSFSANTSYEVGTSILSFNEWYSVDATPWTIVIGSFSVVISILNQLGNDVTDGQTKPINTLTISAIVSGLEAGTYFWNLGDSLSGDANPEIRFYTIEGTKNISLSAYSLADVTISAIDTATILVSATSAEYYVNITSAYDVCASNSGTSADPFNWAEFKGMVETSGDYLDTYRLSGSRALSASSVNRYPLKVDRRKRFTIRDWDVSACGPWVLEIEDFSILDQNSILSAAGCILKNGIIYNKKYGSPGSGGQIVIGTTYDMFIVYQGQYSRIVIEPYSNLLSGNTVVTSADAKIIGSTLYLSGAGWRDLFLSADFLAVGQSAYSLELTDSVITKFQPENTSYFCDCNVAIYYSTFDRAQSAISGDFNVSATVYSQFSWAPPTDYPFTSTNVLYDKDIVYIVAHKNKLRPFSNIPWPPNPGKNSPTYLGYETGLFGYSRANYTSGSS